MSFLEEVIGRTRRIERLLDDMGAEGRGIHEQVTSLQTKLPAALVNRLRFVRTVRNKLMHEDGYRFDGEQSDFLKSCDVAIEELENIAKPRMAPPPKVEVLSPQTARVGPTPTEQAVRPVVIKFPDLQSPVATTTGNERNRPFYATAICLACCLCILPFTCTHRTTIVTDKGWLWDTTKEVDAAAWDQVVTFTCVYCTVVYFLVRSLARGK